jgi:hypothetical protein
VPQHHNITRRTFLAGAIFLPSLLLGTPKFGGTHFYYCDVGEEAVSFWEVEAACIFRVTWGYRQGDHYKLLEDNRVVPGAGDVVGWFHNDGTARLLFVSWLALVPATWTGGSCVI